MKRIIRTLNEMSFDLPKGYQVSQDRYFLDNGQGFINRENYFSQEGRVISLFEVHRDPEEFYQSYQQLTEKYSVLTGKYEFIFFTNLRIKDFIFPLYVIRGFKDELFYTLQVFVNCGDCLGCFMITTKNFDSDIKAYLKKEPAFADLVKLLRTVE